MSRDLIDLSRLPPPVAVQVPDFEAVLAELKADVIARAPELAPALALESEPTVKLLEVFAYREVLLRSRQNDSVRSVMLAFAAGSDLDQLAALLGVERLIITPADPLTGAPAVMEGDEALRRRVVLASDGFSVAGPAGAYVYHALSANGLVKDASATSPEPGVVVVTVLSRLDGGVAGPDLLGAVAVSVTAEDVRPLTDLVDVRAAQILPFTVEGEVFTFAGPDPSVVLAAARAKLDAYLDESFALGRDVTLSGLYAALHVEGVQRVDLTAPAANIVVSPTQAARCEDVILDHAGVGT